MAGLLDLLYPQPAQGGAGTAAGPGFNMGLVNTGLGLMRPQGMLNGGLLGAAAQQRAPVQQRQQCPQQPAQSPLQSYRNPYTPPEGSAY